MTHLNLTYGFYRLPMAISVEERLKKTTGVRRTSRNSSFFRDKGSTFLLTLAGSQKVRMHSLANNENAHV
jgi:hypothetical protein